MDKIVKLVFDQIVGQEIENTGRNFTEKEVADIISVVAIMVGDPIPGQNKELYLKFMEHMNLPDHLNEHLVTSVMASRAALKECLTASQNKKDDVDELISKLMGNININDLS